jgi:glutathione S-transferase
MAAAYLDVALDQQSVVTSDEPVQLLSANPMGKIPTLVLDVGFAIFDSRSIMQEIDRIGGKKLYPRNADKRRLVERLEAAGDGLSDVLVAQIYERRYRPEEKVHQGWIDKQAEKARRSFDWLEANLMPIRGKLNGGQFAVAAALSYADLRFPENNWRRGRPKLKRFEQRFAQTLEEYDLLKSI